MAAVRVFVEEMGQAMAAMRAAILRAWTGVTRSSGGGDEERLRVGHSARRL